MKKILKAKNAVTFFILVAGIALCCALLIPQRTPGRGEGRDAGGAGPDQAAIPSEASRPDQIRVEEVRSAPVPGREVVAPGRIVFDVGKISRILLPAAGRIDRVLVQLGDSVIPGQELLTLDSPEADLAVAECRQSEAALNQAHSAVAKAQADLERTNDLFVHQAIARKDVLGAEYDLALARATLDQAEATLTHFQRRLEILGLRPGEKRQKLAVTTMVAGKVIEISVTPGEYRTDTSASIMTVADLRTVWVISEVPENAIRFIEPGERVQLELVAYPGEVFYARVTRIADTVDPKTRTIQVRAELPNPGGRLRPEMYGRIRHSHEAAMLPLVPSGAVVRGRSGPFVFAECADGAIRRVPVEIGEPQGGDLPVLKGIKAGDRIVVGGAMLLTGVGTR